MNVHIAKWGNSMAIRLPKNALDSAGLREGDALDLVMEANGTFIMTPLKRRHSLEELVARITPDNRHDAMPWGERVGAEEW